MRRGPTRGGRLLAVEGIDGTGKSTLVRALARALRRRGERVAVRREPVDPMLGRLAQEASRRDPWTGAVYFTLDRHMALPALLRDLSTHDLVLTDRSFYSTLAYQGSALAAADRTRLARLQRRVTVVPDRVILLDLGPAEALRRVGDRSPQRGPLEQRRILDRVSRAYRRMARAPGWIVVDARRPTAAIVGEVVSRLVGAARAGDRRSRRTAARRRR